MADAPMTPIQRAVARNQANLAKGPRTYVSVAEGSPNPPAAPLGSSSYGPVRGNPFIPGQVLDTNIAQIESTSAPLRSGLFLMPSPVANTTVSQKAELAAADRATRNLETRVAAIENTPVATTDPNSHILVHMPVPPAPPITRLQPHTGVHLPAPPRIGQSLKDFYRPPIPVAPIRPAPATGDIGAQIANQKLQQSYMSPVGVNPSLTHDFIGDGLNRVAIDAGHASVNVAYNFRGVWSATTAYVQGDEVVYVADYWLCLANNTNSTPTTANGDWQVVGSYSSFLGAWNSTTAYAQGAEVTYNGNFWVATAANTNSAPSTSNPNWQIAGPANLDNVADGVTYQRPLATALTSGQVDLSKAGVVSKVLSNIADDATYSRIHTSEITGNNWDASKAGNSHSQAQYISSITGLIRNLIPDSEWRTFNASSPLYWTQVGGSGWSIYNGAGQTGGNLLNFFGTGSPSPVNYVYSKPFYLSAGSYTISFYVNASNVTSWNSFPAAVNDRFLSYTSFGSNAFPTLGVAQRFSQNFTITIKNYAHSTAFSVGDLIIDSNGHGQICSTAGTTGGSSPTWSSVIGNFTNDGSAVWRCHSLTGQVGVSILINVNGTTITNGGALQISGLQLETQNSAGLATAYRVNDGDDTSGTTLIDFASGSHASKVLDNIGDGATYIRPAYVNADHTFHVSTPLVNQSSISGSAGDTTSYTSTTSSITWSWNAFSLYFPDGTTLSVSSGSTQFTGLAANTTYYFDMYIVKSTLTMTIVLSDQNSGQSPSSTQYLVQTIGADGHVVLWTDRTAVSAASGGGSGGGGTCFSGDVKVQTAQGFVRMDALPDEFEIVNLTGHHRATVIRHPVSDETLQVMPCGGLVTSGHLIKQGDGWASASSVFPRESERRGIPLYDIHVDTGMPENMHYILENGFIAHNKSRVSCFDAATRVRTPEGWVRFDDLSPRDRVQTADGIFDAVVFSHATNGKGRFCVLPSGSIATDDHLVKLVPAEAWKHADELFPVTDEMPFKVFNLAVVGSDYYETEDVLAHDRDMEGA